MAEPVMAEEEKKEDDNVSRLRDRLRAYFRTRPKRVKWLWSALAVAGLVVIFATWRYLAVRESTDDAQIDGDIVPISARVSGYVTHVLVRENEIVESGATLVQIDPADYKVALERAEAELADAQASAHAANVGVPLTSTSASSDLSSAQADVDSARAAVEAANKENDAAKARVAEAEANQDKAQKDLARYQQLITKDEVSQQQFDQAVATQKAAVASVEATRAQLAASEQHVTQAVGSLEQAQAAFRVAQSGPQRVDVERLRAEAAEATVKKFQAEVDRAKLNLSYTNITAPVEGIVGKKAVQVGQYVQAGQPLMALVPTGDIWVTANFKETQLADMHPGQRVIISVDAYRGRKYLGHVDSIAGATGAKFSLLPPENATGNYVKVVQRVPVKIVFETGQDPEHRLKPGMSVVPTVITR